MLCIFNIWWDYYFYKNYKLKLNVYINIEMKKKNLSYMININFVGKYV